MNLSRADLIGYKGALIGLTAQEQVEHLCTLIDRMFGVERPEMDLTRSETIAFNVMNLALGRVVDRDTLLDAIYGDAAGNLAYFDRNIDSHMKRLRKKITQFGYVIEAHYGLGYCMTKEGNQ